MSKLRHFLNSDELYALLDGKVIARKSLYTARVYSEPYDEKHPFVEYTSRLQHCDSCIDDQEYGYGIDQCCCIHAQFKSKKAENEYVKSLGFWKLAKEANQ